MQILRSSSTLAKAPPFQGYLTATEPVGGVHDSIPLNPDQHHPDFNSNKRKKERKSDHDDSTGAPGGKPPDPEHLIDEYACPVQIVLEMIM